MNNTRELAAILFSDISEFTQTMDRDENLAMDQVLRHKEIISDAIKEYNGHLLKEMGDGLLVKFTSAIESVKCAIHIQQVMKIENFSIRMGIHLGDVITKNSDVFGSGVNIASRIQTASSPGSICISKEIWLQIKNQSEIGSKSLGAKAIKGINEKIEVFELVTDKSTLQSPSEENESYPYLKKFILPVTGLFLTIIGGIFWVSYSFFDFGLSKTSFNTSIAILELKNIGSESNSFFAEGLTEELISQLNRIKNLKVTPRTDVGRYKGDDQTIIEIAKELDVEYIVEGSVRISGDDLRVITTLFDTAGRGSIWSGDYDDKLKNIIQVQDKIASHIVSKLNATIANNPFTETQLRRLHPIGNRLTKSLEAMEFTDLAIDYLHNENYSNIENAKAAIPLLDKAIAQDSTYGGAHALMALARFILVEKLSDKNELIGELMKISLQVKIALLYDSNNELALAEKTEYSQFIEKAEKIDFELKNHRLQLDLITEKLLGTLGTR